MDEKILYLDCASGISGDMTVGALLDLGASREKLVQALESLGVSGYHLHFGRTKKCGIDAYDFDVHLEEEEHHHAQNTAHILGVITICQVISHGQKTIFMTKGNQLATNQKSRKNHTEHSSRYRNSHPCIAYTVNGSRCTKKCSHGKLG